MAEVAPETPLADSVTGAVEAMPWLKDSDQATVALAYKYAKAIDDAGALAAGDGDAKAKVAAIEAMTKALYLGPHLLKTLSALGGTPADRKELQAEGSVGGKLASLRQKRQQREQGQTG